MPKYVQISWVWNRCGVWVWCNLASSGEPTPPPPPCFTWPPGPTCVHALVYFDQRRCNSCGRDVLKGQASPRPKGRGPSASNFGRTPPLTPTSFVVTGTTKCNVVTC